MSIIDRDVLQDVRILNEELREVKVAFAAREMSIPADIRWDIERALVEDRRAVTHIMMDAQSGKTMTAIEGAGDLRASLRKICFLMNYKSVSR